MKKSKIIGLTLASFALVLSAGAVASVAAAKNSNPISVRAGTAGSATLPGSQGLTTSNAAVGGDTNILIKTSATNSYTSPIRIYTNNIVTISTVSSDVIITSIVYNANSSSYATVASNATVSPTATPTKSSNAVTWTYDESSAVTQWTFKPSAQTRADSIVVNYINNGSAKSLESVSCDPISVLPGQTTKANPSFTPADASEKGVTYSITAGADCASVDANGNVTGIKSGSATLHIVPKDTNASAIDVDVTVGSYPETQGVVVGKKYAMTANDTANSYTGELAEISGNLGKTAQYATTPSCNFALEVVEGYYPNTVAFKNGENYLSYHGTSNYLYTSTTKDAESSWSVTETAIDGKTGYEVRNIANYGRYLSFNYNNGSTPRFACYANTNYIFPTFYEVVEKTLTDFSLANLTIYQNQSASMDVTYDPADASDKTLTWSSADESIATVDANGVVTGVGVGSTTITASKMIDGNNVSHDATVTVVSSALTHAGTSEDPYTIKEAVILANGWTTGTKESVYVKGLLTKKITSTVDNCSFWMGDDVSQISATTGGFEAYKIADMTSATLGLLKVGNTVTVCGTITIYNGTSEFNSGCTLAYNSYAQADSFAGTFNDAASTLCPANTGNAYGSEAPAAFLEKWNTGASLYSALSDVEKAHIVSAVASATGDNVAKFVSTYDYCVNKYTNLNEFVTGRVVAKGANFVPETSTADMNTAIAVSAFAIAGIGLVGALFVYNKKKESK